MKIYVIPLLHARLAYFCQSTPKKQTYLSRITTYASKKWEALSHSEKTSWKGRLYIAGQQIFNRIDHQEYFLKGVPLKEEGEGDGTPVPLFYPSKVITPSEIRMNLEQLLDRRSPYHRKYMIYSATFVPFTATFTIIPFVPNIPLFYNLFRLYSHYRAYKGTEHLRHLMADNRLSPTASVLLDKIYSDVNLKNDDAIPEQKIEEIANTFQVPGLEIDVKRARHQVLVQLDKGKLDRGNVKNKTK